MFAVEFQEPHRQRICWVHIGRKNRIAQALAGGPEQGCREACSVLRMAPGCLASSIHAVRREIAEPRRETGARSPEAPMRTRAVC